MSPRLTTMCSAIGLAVAISLGAASTSQAQNTTDTSSAARSDTTGPTSQRRIRVSKEQGGGALDTTSAGGAIAPTDTMTRDTTGAAGGGVTDTTGMRRDTTGMSRDTTGGAAGGAAGGVTDTSRMRDTTGRDTTGMGVTGAGAATDSATNRSNMSADTTTNPARSDTTMGRDTSGMSRDTTTSQTGVTANPPTGVSTDTTGNAPRSDTLTTTPATPDTMQAGATVSPATPSDTGYNQPGTARSRFFQNGFYIGAGGGAAIPVGNFKDGYNTGWNVNIPIGWQSQTTPWGVQLDASYDRMNGKSLSSGGISANVPDASIWAGMLDLTFRVPLGAESRSGLYLLGGGGVHHFKDYGGSSVTSGGVTYSSTGSSATKFGVNGGAGFDFPVGMLNLYVEGRFISVFTKGKNTNYVPVVAGIKFF